MNAVSVESANRSRHAALRRSSPFDRVREVELALLAEAATSRTFAPGAIVHAGGQPLARVMIVAAGMVRDEKGRAVGPICGLDSMFHGTPVERLTADAAQGAEVVWITKHAFFTVARECPELVRGFLEIGPEGAIAPADGESNSL